MTNQTGTGPAIGATEITHASIIEVLRRARTALVRTSAQWPNVGPTINEIDRLLDDLTRPNPDTNSFFWWLLAVGIPSDLVADGRVLDDQLEDLRDVIVGSSYRLTADRIERLRAATIIKVIDSPTEAAIKKAQEG